MVEAINEESAIPMVDFDDRKEKEDPLVTFFRKYALTSTYEFSTTGRKYTYGPATLFDMVNYALSEKTIAAKVVAKLQELGLTQYEKKLGEGAFGVVLKIHGESKRDIALKLEKRPIPIANKDKELFGDALGLKLPSGQHLGTATGLLTYHQGKVHYIENYDPKMHSKHLLVGVFSKAINGIPLWNRVRALAPLNSEAVKGYGKRLAEALHALHANGYIHNDLHKGNILVKNAKEGKDPYRLQLLDFGLATKGNPEGVKNEWRSFAHLLASIGSKQKLSQSPKFSDLLYNPERGLLIGNLPYSGNEIVNHPFFV